MQNTVPICKKIALTISEAAAYSNIGENTLRELSHRTEYQHLFLRVGRRVLIKRELLDQFIKEETEISTS